MKPSELIEQRSRAVLDTVMHENPLRFAVMPSSVREALALRLVIHEIMVYLDEQHAAKEPSS